MERRERSERRMDRREPMKLSKDIYYGWKRRGALPMTSTRSKAGEGFVVVQMVQEDVIFRPFKLTAYQVKGTHEQVLGVTRIDKPTLFAVDSAARRILHGVEVEIPEPKPEPAKEEAPVEASTEA